MPSCSASRRRGIARCHRGCSDPAHVAGGGGAWSSTAPPAGAGLGKRAASRWPTQPRSPATASLSRRRCEREFASRLPLIGRYGLRGAGVEYRCSPQRPQSDSVPAVEYYETSGGHMRTVRLTLVTLAVAVLAGGAPLRAHRWSDRGRRSIEAVTLGDAQRVVMTWIAPCRCPGPKRASASDAL